MPPSKARRPLAVQAIAWVLALTVAPLLGGAPRALAQVPTPTAIAAPGAADAAAPEPVGAAAPLPDSGPITGAVPGLVARLQGPAGRFTVGDPITFTLTVSHAAGYRVAPPLLPREWGGLEIRDQGPAYRLRDAAGGLSTRQTIVATAFAPGEGATPELVITVLGPEGETASLTLPPLRYQIASVLPENDRLPRDIRPQAEVPAPPRWPAALGALALVGLALALGRRFLRRRGGPEVLPAEPVPVDARSPYRVAMDELDRIDGLGLVAAGALAPHYDLVSDCARGYLGARFDLPALDQTSAELWEGLRAAGLDPELREPVARFLATADLVKFARLDPQAEPAARLTEEARLLLGQVERAHPMFMPPGAETGERTP